MYKFLPGLVLLQVISVAVVFLSMNSLNDVYGWLRILVPLGAVTVLVAFWFSAIALDLRKDEIMKLRENHAKEREKIRVNAERAKQKASKEALNQATQEIRRSTAKANIKMGAAFAGAAAVGGFLLITQFMMLGTLVLTTAGGTLGGYLFRLKQESNKKRNEQTDANILPNHAPKLIGGKKILSQVKDK